MSFFRIIVVVAILFVLGLGTSYGENFFLKDLKRNIAGTWMLGPGHISLVSPKNIIAIMTLSEDSNLTYQHAKATWTNTGKWRLMRGGRIELKINAGTSQEIIYTARLLRGDLSVYMDGHTINSIKRTPQFEYITIEKVRVSH